MIVGRSVARIGVHCASVAASLLLTFAIYAASPSATPPDEDQEEPHLELYAPWSVLPNSQFVLSVEYVAGPDAGPTTVTLESTSGTSYSKRSMTLKPGETGEVTVSFGHTVSGLAQLMLNTKLDKDPSPRLTLDAGFSGTVEWRKPRPIDSYGTESMVMSFVDNHHRTINLDAGIQVQVIAPTRAQVRTASHQSWASSVLVDVPSGASETEAIEIKPSGFSASTEELHVVGWINPRDPDKQVLFMESIPFQVVPPVWMRLAVTIVGALLCSLWQYSRRAERVLTWALGRAIFASVIAAVVAFALADLNVLGIRIDTTQLTGYFVVGVLVSYIGLDQMLERVAKKASDEKKRSLAEKETGPTTTPSDTP